MQSHSHIRRFRSNPVELLVFSAIALLFINSIYDLFYEPAGFNLAALAPMHSNPISEGRHLASVQDPLLTLNIPCNSTQETQTAANRVRIMGPICRGEDSEVQIKNTTPMKSSIQNTSNHFNAAVFFDEDSGKFATEYIPLVSGENKIEISFKHKDGETVSQNLRVIKN
jgi:hypothetical protein